MNSNRLTVETLREMGYHAKIVQTWNHAAKIRQDLFGVVDVLALQPDLGVTLAVQACGVGDRAAHARTLIESTWTPVLVRSGWDLELWAWEKRRRVWQVRRYRVLLGEGGEVALAAQAAEARGVPPVAETPLQLVPVQP